MKLAIVGSRAFPHLEDVRSFVSTFYARHPQAVVISGGAAGVDREAEQQALALGGQVISYRPVRLGDLQWGVERWELGGDTPHKFLLSEPASQMWESFAGAAWYRNLLIAEECDAGVAFWDQKSNGTRQDFDAFAAHGKRYHVYTDEKRFVCE